MVEVAQFVRPGHYIGGNGVAVGVGSLITNQLAHVEPQLFAGLKQLLHAVSPLASIIEERGLCPRFLRAAVPSSDECVVVCVSVPHATREQAICALDERRLQAIAASLVVGDGHSDQIAAAPCIAQRNGTP